MKKKLLISTLFFRLIIMANLFFANIVFSQSLGDYQSAQTGNWTDPTSWKYWDGDSWETPSGVSPYGYPGQYPGTGKVLIQEGHTITIGTSGITTQLMGTLTVDGTLELIGLPPQVGGVDFNINTLSIVVTFIVDEIYGVISFVDKANLVLPENATLQVTCYPNPSQDPTYKGLDGDCSAQQSIVIGTLEYAVCKGNTADTGLTFEEVMQGTGTLNANINNTPLVVCKGDSVNIGGSFTGVSGNGVTYTWTIKENNTVPETIMSGQTVAITYTVVGTYKITLTCETSYKSYLYTNSETIYVNVSDLPAKPIITAGGPITFCSGGSVTLTSSPEASYLWSTGATTPSISPTTSGSYTVQVTNAAGCLSSLSDPIVVSVNTIPAAPVLNNVILGCNQTSVNGTWGAIPNSNNYLFDAALDSSFGTYVPGYHDVSVAPSASPTVTVNGLNPNLTYYVRARTISSCGTSGYSATVTVSVPITKTANGVTWDNGVPDSDKRVIFEGNASITSPLNACSCQINSGVNVVVGVPGGGNADAILKLENELTVLGTITFENNASLIQVDDAAVNTGSIIYKRNSTPMKNFDFTRWSSPVAGQMLNALSPNTLSDKYYRFSGGSWITILGGNASMLPGIGYSIRVPKPDIVFPNGEYWTGSTYIQEFEFNGIPNNGVISVVSQGAGQFNFIGNPYPSAIDADEFIKQNAALIGDGPLYFWTHHTGIAQSGSFYVYNPNDYVTYTLVGGIGTGSAATGLVEPNGTIGAGQGFFVISKVDGPDFKFNNSMRNIGKVLNPGSNSQFFRMSQSKNTEEVEKNRVWLNLTNSDGVFKQLLVGYITGATNDIDNLYDGAIFDENLDNNFYSINSGKNLAIQGRALPFEEADQVPLGYKTTVKGHFTISIDKVDGVLTDQNIFIEDKVTGTITNLKKGSYTFSTGTGVFNDRFILRFMDNSVASRSSGKVASDKKGNSVLVSVKNKQIKINSFDETLEKVMVYDLKTSLLYKNESINNNEYNISNFNSGEQFLIVQILLKNGKWVTKEIVF